VEFIGNFTPRLDDKGRLTLPAKFRSELDGSDVVLTMGPEHSITVYPRAEFDRMKDRVIHGPGGANARAMKRLLASSADPQVPDGQGRIAVAPMLRRYARLDRDCTVIGGLDVFEIWDTATWEQYFASSEQMYVTSREEDLPGLV
jgi:MraZ protein